VANLAAGWLEIACYKAQMMRLVTVYDSYPSP
jgi:hypothetical protein